MSEPLETRAPAGMRPAAPTGLRQLIIYGCVGGVTTLADWGSFYVANNLLRLPPMPYTGTLLAFLTATVVSYSLHNTFTFRLNVWHDRRQLAAYLIAWVVMLSVHELLMHLLTHPAQCPPLLARIFTTAIIFPFNYLLLKRWVFVQRNG